jgi:hypothetical protein
MTMSVAIKRMPVLVLSAAVLLTGCAADNRQPALTAATPVELPGTADYYAQATAHPRRAVRKPIRDEQAYARRELAKSADMLLAQSKTWDSEARLVALNDNERTARREAVDRFRAALAGLKAAAEKSDIPALQAEYAAATASYRQLVAIAGVPGE